MPFVVLPVGVARDARIRAVRVVGHCGRRSVVGGCLAAMGRVQRPSASTGRPSRTSRRRRQSRVRTPARPTVATRRARGTSRAFATNATSGADRGAVDVRDPPRRPALCPRPRVEAAGGRRGPYRPTRDCGIRADQVDREQLETRAGTGSTSWRRPASSPWCSASSVSCGSDEPGRPIEGLVGFVAMAVVVALATYGNTRFRTTAEPALLIGVAAALQPVSCACGSSRPRP